MRLRAIVLGLLAVSLLAALGQLLAQERETDATDPVLSKLHVRVNRFFSTLANDEEQTAFEELLTGSPLARQTAARTALLEKAKKLEDLYGKYHESERVTAKHVGKDIVVLTYLFKCQNLPVVWHLVFYREQSARNELARDATGDEDKWAVVSLRFDTQLEQL